MENLAMLWGIIGPGVAGALFGAGWWFWVDAVVCSAVQVSFIHYLPGIFASLAALMFNCVDKDAIGNDYYSSYGDDSEWRVKLWLFVAYVVSFVCLAGSVGLLVQDALTDKGPSVWTGVAGVLQCVFVLIRYISNFVSASLLDSLGQYACPDVASPLQWVDILDVPHRGLGRVKML
ncbi:unnamed protein product [Triticum turgidum subsp. durum]|uniref:Transmembrane protein 50A n=1 Tax=Triticum turgidum subsp. durum TaxID=4567 RepID=A0A9R0TRP0_TRITD|nr:unnamed protein product [Triticum turgidum subsp. durum]